MKNEYFSKDYVNFQRFHSYFYQLETIRDLKPKNLLEIGVGNCIVSNFFREGGLNVVTCDYDPKLKPDVVADIRNLPFKKNQFDVVCAFEVLEHLPFDDFEKVLKELKRVSRRFVVISIPYSSASLELVMQANVRNFSKMLSFSLKIPYFFLKIMKSKKKRQLCESEEHYWEIGRKNYPKSKIKEIIEKYFRIEREFHPPLFSYHYFLVLKK